MNTNGSYFYGSVAGSPGAETVHERRQGERFWRALGKTIRKSYPTPNRSTQ